MPLYFHQEVADVTKRIPQITSCIDDVNIHLSPQVLRFGDIVESEIIVFTSCGSRALPLISARSLAHALIVCRIDYCNSVLHGQRCASARTSITHLSRDLLDCSVEKILLDDGNYSRQPSLAARDKQDRVQTVHARI